MLTNKTYDTLKIVALLVLPIGTFVATVCGIWGLPYADQLQQTFVAMDVLCGAIVTLAKARYDEANGGQR